MQLNTILEQTIPGLGYELVDIEITPAKIIRVFIDKEGGVTVDDCEQVSNHITRLFAVEDIDFNRLEVSSPGLERTVKKLEDFARFTGKLAKIKTRELINKQKSFQGIILGILGSKVKLQLENEKILEIEFDIISRSRLVFEYKTSTKLKK